MEYKLVRLHKLINVWECMKVEDVGRLDPPIGWALILSSSKLLWSCHDGMNKSMGKIAYYTKGQLMRGNLKEVLQKVFGKRKGKSRKSSSVYIVDILVMIVFFANHNVTLVYLY